MIWTIIKKGTSGDKKAPPIVDDTITSDIVAVEKGRQVLYKNENVIQIKTLYFKFEIDDVIYFSNKYYKVLSGAISELPYVTLTLKELPDV